MDFMGFAKVRGIDTGELWIATVNEQLIWSTLPVTSPGRTMLLFVPGDYSSPLQALAAKTLIQRIVSEYAVQNIDLAQILLDPGDQRMIDLCAAASFTRMAELIYLQINMPSGANPFPVLPANCRLVNYSSQTHSLFADAISRSYAQSLDCPALAGLREIEDIIIGHKAAGVFDPNYWFALIEDDRPIGVTLLSPLPANQSMELVYLGLIPEARGKKFGDLLMRLTLALTARSRYPRLNFAVDSLNSPALKLYFRHGMARVGTKIAMLRDLRNHDQASRG